MKIQCNENDPDFFFDEDLHVYTYKGKRVASVTQVMKATGLSTDYAAVDPKVLANAAARGTAVHKAIEALNEGKLEPKKIHETIVPRVEAYKRFVKEYEWDNICSERKYYSPKWQYAGGMDLVGFLPCWNGLMGVKRVLLDIKTSYQMDLVGWSIQLQAYKNLWNENNPNEPIEHTAVLWLNSRGEYEFEDVDSEEAWALFVYGRKILAWKQKHNR